MQPSETIQQIADVYGTTVEDLVKANELENQKKLVVGQALVIPILGFFYTVKAGDSLWLIGQKFQIPYQKIAQINRIPVNQLLQIGMRLYIPSRKKRLGAFNAYVQPTGDTIPESLENDVRKRAPYLTYLALPAFRAKRDGSLSMPPLGAIPDIAKANQNIMMMVITNQEGDQFSDELGRIILNDTEVQNRLIENIISTAKKNGFGDIHIDFEFLRPVDREAYGEFLRKLKTIVSKEGLTLSTALAPKTSATQKGQWYEAHDYRMHGEIADFVVIMTYEWGYTAGPPMPVSPIGPVREVLEYALTEIPSEKILMGQNLYGYNWTLPFVKGESRAKSISPQQAILLAEKYGVNIQYDEKEQAPFFDYVDEENKEHKVWFEDARSIQAKFNLLKELNLRGMSYWKLGISFPQNWLLLQDNFEIIKG